MPRLSDEQWARALEDVRAARGSLREIAARHGISHVALKKRADKDGIKADLAVEVKAETERRLMLVKGDSKPPKVTSRKVTTAKVTKPNARTDDEIVAEAAEEREAIVRSHRRDIAMARANVAMLQEQLQVAGKHRAELQALIVANRDPKDPARTAAMMRLVALPSHAGVARDLATAQRTLVLLERQAYRIDEKTSDGGIESWLKKIAEEDAAAAA
jgi:hypothetical protein